MTWHSIGEYLKYRRKSKDLHGVHSPFVYAFNEQVLHHPGKGRQDSVVLITSGHKKLINRIIEYFNCGNIFWVTNKLGEKETYLQIVHGANGKVRITSERIRFEDYASYPPPDMLLIDLEDPKDWLPVYQRYAPRLKKDSLVAVNLIHQSKAHSEAWERLYTAAEVRVSIDLYKTGLLFFNEDIHDKQHFVLKY